ncbi:MAG: GtrA family protein [Actinomyces urogenitalis]|uniref:GtrA family protein n=1 Tax=Actinomyces urogenitalis TaxID=103621 RepID=UPI00050FE366|nr:GtrA family protein [Actinomyces urogenitalis]KGF01255.1 polysaccharide synthesis protein GtrA [Actinomyces urogenitalis S6-C4]MDU5875333.1 GtrA family protein [Actinomyces urogenitalis]
MERYSPLVHQFARFLVVGGISFSIDYGIFTLLFTLGVPHLVASMVSFTISLVVNYWLSRRFVFEVNEEVSIAREFTAYVGLNVIALGLNTGVLYVCSDLMRMSPFIGKIIATAIVLVYNFISRKILLERMGSGQRVSEAS